MPSTTSSSLDRLFASSEVITPSRPTFSMARAIMLPISRSPFAEIVPTWATSSLVDTALERAFSSLTTASTATSIPRFRSIGFIPAATALAPSRTIACASTVAVVVPSPASSEVFEATSRSICAPMFSNLSESSISLATVTPSLVMRGAPKLFSRTTLRPFGPSVTFTAFASISTPCSIRCRASEPHLTSLAAIGFGLRELGLRLLFDDAEEIGFLHDQQLLAVDLDLRAGPLAEQHPVAGLDVERNDLAVLVAPARADGDHLAFLRLLLRGVRNDDAAFGLLFLLDALDDHAVVQRPKLHRCSSLRNLEYHISWVGVVSTLSRRV